MVAVPEVAGVQRKTVSGAPAVADAAQLAESALVPAVRPVTVPPAAGSSMGLAQVPAGRVVLVVLGGMLATVVVVPIVEVVVAPVGRVLVVLLVVSSPVLVRMKIGAVVTCT